MIEALEIFLLLVISLTIVRIIAFVIITIKNIIDTY